MDGVAQRQPRRTRVRGHKKLCDRVHKRAAPVTHYLTTFKLPATVRSPGVPPTLRDRAYWDDERFQGGPTRRPASSPRKSRRTSPSHLEGARPPRRDTRGDLCPTSRTSKPSSTRRSGRACGARRATCRTSRSRCSRPRPPTSRCCSSSRCRSRRRRWRRSRRPSSAPGIHLGVWRDRRRCCASGARARTLPPLCFVARGRRARACSSSSITAATSGKFVNVAVLEGDQIKIVDERASSLPDCPALLTSLLGFDAPASWVELGRTCSCSSRCRCARTAAAACCWSCRPASDAWRDRSCSRLPTPSSPPFTRAGATCWRAGAGDRGPRSGRTRVDRAVDAIAGLTAVDGATVITDRLRAAGLRREDRAARRIAAGRAASRSPSRSKAATPTSCHPTQLGGTRHLSAAQFVHDQRDAVALVASQDGRFTVFAWSPCEDMVHAHRVETLLL